MAKSFLFPARGSRAGSEASSIAGRVKLVAWERPWTTSPRCGRRGPLLGPAAPQLPFRRVWLSVSAAWAQLAKPAGAASRRTHVAFLPKMHLHEDKMKCDSQSEPSCHTEVIGKNVIQNRPRRLPLFFSDRVANRAIRAEPDPAVPVSEANPNWSDHNPSTELTAT